MILKLYCGILRQSFTETGLALAIQDSAVDKVNQSKKESCPCSRLWTGAC